MKISIKSKIAAVLAIVLMNAIALAETHEIMTMTEIERFVDEDTLVVFDIDNTLAESSETIGSVQWQENEIARAEEEGIPKDKAQDRSIRRFAAVSFAGKLRPVEATTPLLLQKLRSSGAKIMALTARPAEIHERTLYLLSEIGIHLNQSAPLNTLVRNYFNEQVIYNHGVLAVGATNDKGKMLEWLMSQQNFSSFKRLVFVDDKLKYVKSVETAFANKGLEVHTFRYGAADERVKNFDESLARKQTDYFLKYGKILPDAEAKR